MLRHLSWAELKATCRLSLPLILSEVLQSATPFFGVLIVARLGSKALAASALVNLAWFSLIAFCFGLLNAISILVSRLYGQNQHQQIKVLMSQALIVVLMITVIIFSLFSLLPYLLAWTGQPEEIVRLSGYYEDALRWAIPAFILTVALEQFLYGIHQTRLIFIISLLQIPFEIIAMFVLAFGLFGAPKLGIRGVGYAQDASSLFNYFKKLILLAGVYQVVDCFRVIMSGALRAFKDTSFLMSSSVIAYFGIAMPCAYYFSFILNLGASGVWWGMISGSIIGGLLVGGRLYNRLCI